MKTAELILTNGRFLTMERPGETAEAVAIAGGRILFVGTAEEARQYADADTTVIDLEGKVAAPGLIDCHTHSAGYTTRFVGLNFQGEKSMESLLNRIREAAETTPKGEWIVCRSYDESKLREGTILSAALLDTVAPEHPVFVARTCGHVSVVNTLAMKLSGFTDESQDPPTGGHFFRDAQGHLTGMISGSLSGKVPFPAMTAAQQEEAMISGVQATYFKNGITASTEMGRTAPIFRMLQRLDMAGKLKLRIGFYMSTSRSANDLRTAQVLSKMGILSGFGSERFFFRGIKFVMDGSTGGKTAAFSQPYLGEPDNYGELYNDPAILRGDMLLSAKAGVQISIHAIGDRAIEEALQALEYVVAQGVMLPPVRMEHVESPTPDQIRRIKALGIDVALSSAFIYHLGDSHLAALGYDRLVDAFPAKTLMDAGINVACNTDCPVCDVNPMLGIYSMVNRVTEKGQSFGGKKEAIDRIRALESYTKNASKLLGLEAVAGTLKAGKYADIVVFRDDFLAVSDEQLKDVQVAMTLSSGEIVYQNEA